MQTSGRALVMLAVVAALISAEDASARAVRLSCRDGLIAQSLDRAGRVVVSCDVDGQCDGVCSFEVPACGTATCETDTLTVPVRSTRRERIAVDPGAPPTKLVLRCRATPSIVHCATITIRSTTTTTTSGSSTTTAASQPGLTTTTRVILREPSTTSSTTSTSCACTLPTTTTTSTIPPVPCVMDGDCEGLQTACATSFCAAGGTCALDCFCLTTDQGRTCDLDAASPCLTPADCPAPDDGTCLVCYLNRCVTTPAPACFF